MLNHWPQLRHNCTGERLQEAKAKDANTHNLIIGTLIHKPADVFWFSGRE